MSLYSKGKLLPLPMLVHSAANHSSVWTEATDIFATALLFFLFSDIGAFFYPVVFGFSLFRPYCFAFSSGSSIDIKLLNITQNKNDIKIPYFILRLDKIITKLTGVKSTANNNVINQLFFWPQFG